MSVSKIYVKNISIGEIEFEIKQKNNCDDRCDKRCDDIELVMKQLIEHIKTLFTGLSNVNEKLEILTDDK
jgi:hypothetical protein